jgi:addiction module HigA family antidote
MTPQRTRRPSHPGEILKELYLDGLGIGISEFAEHVGVSRKTVSSVVNGHARVTPELAVRFSLALPSTSAEMWLNLQLEYDLFDAFRAIPPAAVRPFAAAMA